MLTRDMKHDMFLDRESINLFRKEIVVEINFRAKFINLSKGVISLFRKENVVGINYR